MSGSDTTLVKSILTVAAIVLGGVGWNIDQLTVEQVEWALKVGYPMDICDTC